MTAEPLAPIRFLDNLVTIHASTATTGGQYALLEVRGVAGTHTPWHIHHRDVEGFYVLDGRLRIHIGDSVVVRTAGEFALAEKGVAHAVAVEAGHPARWLVTSGGGFDRLVVAVAAAGKRSPFDGSIELARIGREFDIEVLDLPLDSRQRASVDA